MDYIEEYKNFAPSDKFQEMRLETQRIWIYLKAAIEFIEKKYYQCEEYDVNELIAYCKSCEESYKIIEFLSNSLENDMC